MNEHDRNPFSAPLVRCVPDSIPPLLPEAQWDELDIRVASVIRRWCRRSIRLAGSIDARIDYDPRGWGERVIVNDRLVASSSVWCWHIVQPRLEFFLPTIDYSVPAHIDVRLAVIPPFRTKAFRLQIAGRKVYDE